MFDDIVTSWRVRLTGTVPTETELDSIRGRFTEAEASFGKESAWISMLSVFLRDTNTWLY